jgi:hypothetical protein
MRDFGHTRIFTAAAVLTGLLLCLAVLGTFTSPAALVGAKGRSQPRLSARHTKQLSRTITFRHHGYTMMVTDTGTINTAPTGPSCTASPNPALIGSTVSGTVVFTLFCSGLNPNATASVTSNIVCTTKMWNNTPEPVTIGVAADGTFTPTLIGTSCAPGNYSITVTQVVGGQVVVTPATVTFSSSQPQSQLQSAGPSCSAMPNYVRIGTTILGQAEFTLFCSGLNPNATASVTSNIVCTTKMWNNTPEPATIGVAADGTFTPTLFGAPCAPGNYSITVTQVVGGQVVATPATVTFS